MSKPCGTSFGHDDCGYVFVYADHQEQVPEVKKTEIKAPKKPQEDVEDDNE